MSKQRRVGDTVARGPGDHLGEHPVEGRGEDDAGRGEEHRAHPPEEPQRQQATKRNCRMGFSKKNRREQARIGQPKPGLLRRPRSALAP